MSWLIPRPSPDGQALVTQLQALGIAATAHPAIQIEPLAADHRVIMELDQFDTLVVVSKPAARRLIDEIDQYWPQLPIDQTCIAVGPGTAHILAEYGFVPRVADRHDSQGVLSLCGVAKRVLLAAGQDGRDAIEAGLAHCQLTRLSLYRRSAIQAGPSQQDFSRVWLTSADIATSVAGWGLTHLPAWVPSQRVAQHANTLGFTVERVLPSASDTALINALTEEAV